jgi:hypothetical protein
MHDHNSVGRWLGVTLALLVAIGLGAAAYQAGVAHGLALQIPAGAPAAVPPIAYYPYGWYRPWGFGLFGPFVFILFWFALARMLFWRRRRWDHAGDGPWGFDEWHRRAHERMAKD